MYQFPTISRENMNSKVKVFQTVGKSKLEGLVQAFSWYVEYLYL